MTAIIIAVILAFVLQLAIWEGAILGIAWIIGKIADISVNYPLIGGIVLGLWALILAVKVLFVIGTYREQQRASKEFDEMRKRMFRR
ncbi:hypothetical protein [Lederbergia citri]|uniref:Uncharacterized protein n=1 Tax=Lederbergia citri TaxID=2833580 RepID=A0A942TCN5_9BACI|nr:hypothetical protein [Lederbergia citri]MBS4195360.1 hypothetical protein [Lederbergia citri]